MGPRRGALRCRQTLANGERYITQELKELENRILGAHDRSIALEGKLFEEVRRTIAEQLTRVQETAKAIAELDVLASFASVSVRNDYTRPTITANGRLYLKDSRHPVVEALLTGSAPFVPNDLEMDPNQNRVYHYGPEHGGVNLHICGRWRSLSLWRRSTAIARRALRRSALWTASTRAWALLTTLHGGAVHVRQVWKWPRWRKF